MGPEGAVNIIYRRDIAASPTPDSPPPEADRRLQGALRQPLRGGRARLHRRRDHPARDAPEDDHRAADAADQARAGPQAQARQHPAVALGLESTLCVHGAATAPRDRSSAPRRGPRARRRSAACATARSWIASPVESNSVTASGPGRPGASPASTAPSSVTCGAGDEAGLDRAASARRRVRPAPTRRRTARTTATASMVASALPGPSAPSMLRCRPGRRSLASNDDLGARGDAADDVAAERLLARPGRPAELVGQRARGRADGVGADARRRSRPRPGSGRPRRRAARSR